MMGTQSARVWGGAEQEQVTVACLFLVAAAAYYYICEQKPCGALLVAHHMVLICPVHI